MWLDGSVPNLQTLLLASYEEFHSYDFHDLLRYDLFVCVDSLVLFHFRNCIAKVEEPIHFPYLETMDLSCNFLSLIPDGFLSHCNKLESLNFNDNQLGEQATALKLILLFSVLLCN